MKFLGADLLFWAGFHLARDPMIKLVLATPPSKKF